jgi:hypothetical protein
MLAITEDASSGEIVRVVGGRVTGLDGMRVTVTVTLSGVAPVAAGIEGAPVANTGGAV